MVCGPETSLLLPVRRSAAELAFSYDLPPDDVAGLLRGSRSQAGFVAAFFETVAARRGKRRWAEKTPLNVRHLAWIFRHFPNARFIHVLRDGRDVACSLRSHPVRRFVDGAWLSVPQNRTIASCVGQWLTLTGEGMRWRADPRYVEIRYEDLVQDPETTMRRVMAFVGEPFDEAWLAARLTAQSWGSDATVGSGQATGSGTATINATPPARQYRLPIGRRRHATCHPTKLPWSAQATLPPRRTRPSPVPTGRRAATSVSPGRNRPE